MSLRDLVGSRLDDVAIGLERSQPVAFRVAEGALDLASLRRLARRARRLAVRIAVALDELVGQVAAHARRGYRAASAPSDCEPAILIDTTACALGSPICSRNVPYPST